MEGWLFDCGALTKRHPMKTGSARVLASVLTVAGVCFFAPSSQSQTTPPNSSPPGAGKPSLPVPTPYQIAERGANHQVWERYTFEKAQDGTLVAKPHRIVELATGMNYQKQGQYVKSEEQIIPLPQGGAEAVQGQHQAYFAGDIYQGVIQLVTPDGKHLRGRPVGISYDDGQNTVLIAQLTNSVGVLVSPNQVVYPNAFMGLKADLVLTYRKSGLEQDVVLRENPPTPEGLGLNGPVKLQLLTEFTGSAEPTQQPAMASGPDNLQDVTLTFGGMQMVQGRAFSINDSAGGRRTKQTPTYKSWLHLQGRTFLIEELPYERIAPQLEQLPTTGRIGATETNLFAANSILNKVSTQRLLPPAREVRADTQRIQLARLDLSRQPGVVLDYSAVNTSTGFTFQCDTTYYVSSSVNLSGLTTIEGGTVIKYDTNYTCAVNILGTINCATSPYRPAILTSVSDSTVGEPVYVGNPIPCTGTLNFYILNEYGEDFNYILQDQNYNLILSGTVSASSTVGPAEITAGLGAHFYFEAWDDSYSYDIACLLYTALDQGQVDIDSNGNQAYYEWGSQLCTPPAVSSLGLSLANGGSLNNLNIRNLNTGVQSDGACSVTNLQFVHCGAAFDIEYTNLYAGNILMSYVGLGFAGRNFKATCEHLTFDQGVYLGEDYASGNSSVWLTNSLLTGVSGYGNVTKYTNAVVKLSSSSGVYRTVGAGSYYLTTNSPYHNLGTTTITPALKAQLNQKTTWPPIVYSSVTITNQTTLSPQASRDTDAMPDLGYHYDPLDYVFGYVVAKSNITFTAGTAVGWYDLASASVYGIRIDKSATVSFNGTVTAPCWLARYDMVQEADNGNWTLVASQVSPITGYNSSASYSTNSPLLLMQFTKFSSRNYGDQIRDFIGNFVVCANNCEFYGPIGGGNIQLDLTNCLFYRFAPSVTYSGSGSPSVSMQNCTLEKGSLTIQHTSGSTWPVSIRSCAFDGTTISMNTNGLTCDYNAFLTNANLTPIRGGHEVTNIVSYNWQTSWFGNYYLPTSSTLVNAGGVTADQVGLYHFTSQTNQAVEGGSTVDIGYHYVATDTYGNPLDIDGDGVPNYLEDTNGNGVYDAGDLGDWFISPYNGLSRTNGLLVFTPLK
jgi:hypothetical protein